MTNHHVLRADKIAIPTKELRPEPIELPSVLSPSNVDMTRYLKTLDLIILEANKVIRDPKFKSLAGRYDRIKNAGTEMRREREEARASTELATHFDCHACEIFATSGIRSKPDIRYDNDPHILKSTDFAMTSNAQLEWDVDWGLFLVDSALKPSLCLPKTDDESIRIAGYMPAERASIKENSTYEVAKFGRTSKCTRGMLNPAISLLNLEATNAGIFEPAEDISSTVEKGNAVLCYCIVTPSKDHQGFVKGGDSGSLVVLNDNAQKWWRPWLESSLVAITIAT